MLANYLGININRANDKPGLVWHTVMAIMI